MDRRASLAMTGKLLAMTNRHGLVVPRSRHCEGRRPVAIHAVPSHGSPRFAREDGKVARDDEVGMASR